MNQGKSEVIKQEMARVNIDILGMSELKWTGMGEFNSDDHYIYYCGQESVRRNGVPLIVNKESEMQFLGFSDSSVCKESACNVGDPGSKPGLGRSPGEGISTHSSVLGLPLLLSW